MLPAETSRISSHSFRDPAGYVFLESGVYKRVVTAAGASDYDQFVACKLFDKLVQDGLLVAHTEEDTPKTDPQIHKVLVPDQIQHISYPYEWSFGQLRDAALLTLDIESAAIKHGMSLKDASSFNVQFRGPDAVFIDTLSFEANDGGPWAGYSQFCRHFLAPLLLMSRVAPSFNQFLRSSLDGFPLDLASTLLPASTYLNFGILLHIHLHARSQRKYANSAHSAGAGAKAASRNGSDPKPALIDSLRGLILGLTPGKFHTEWMRYYEEASHYTTVGERSKKEVVSRVLERVRPQLVYDLGGNIGEYSRLATARGIDCICYDLDPLCVHQNYERARAEGDRHMLPLLTDLSNPTPALGFNLRERLSLIERSRADLLLALALTHHLRVTANAPFVLIAQFLARLGRQLLIEYVPKDDVMVQMLLRNRKDTFFDYSEDSFRAEFEKHFTIQEIFPLSESNRKLYLLTASP